MNRGQLILLIILIIGMVALGVSNNLQIHRRNLAIQAWESKEAAYVKELALRRQVLEQYTPLDQQVKLSSNALSRPYLNAAQGVEAHLIGLRYGGKWFDAATKHGIEKLGGISEVQINQVIFDPDFPDSGMPDLNVSVTSPELFKVNNFLKDWYGNVDIRALESYDGTEPIATYNMGVINNKKVNMTHWLLTFETTFRIEPSTRHSNDNIGGLKRHPVTGKSTFNIRNTKEYKDQRYGHVSIMLKFEPKNDHWIMASNEDDLLIPTPSPGIGIAAVECIAIQQVNDKNAETNNIGVYLKKGESLALYNDPQAIDPQFSVTDAIPVSAVSTSTVALMGKEPGTYYNPDFIGKEKYAIIHITNLGSWQEGSWLTSIQRYADQYRAKFLIHVYVFGEWNLKPINMSVPEPRPGWEMKQTGLLDFILPDLNLGWIGKILSGGGWTIVLIIVLAFLFPPFGLLINKMFKWIVFLVPNPPRKSKD